MGTHTYVLTWIRVHTHDLLKAAPSGYGRATHRKKDYKTRSCPLQLKWQGLSCGPSVQRGWISVCKQSHSLRHICEHRLEPRQTHSLTYYALFSGDMYMPCRHSSLLLILYLHTALRINLFHFPNNAYSLVYSWDTELPWVSLSNHLGKASPVLFVCFCSDWVCKEYGGCRRLYMSLHLLWVLVHSFHK